MDDEYQCDVTSAYLKEYYKLKEYLKALEEVTAIRHEYVLVDDADWSHIGNLKYINNKISETIRFIKAAVPEEALEILNHRV